MFYKIKPLKTILTIHSGRKKMNGWKIYATGIVPAGNRLKRA
jgi:hypothetical protein